MTEKWLIAPGQERVIDIASAARLKVSLVGGQVDVIAHDEPGIRIEVHGVTVKDLRIESTGTEVEIDHPQLGWENFLEVFRNFGSGGPRADVTIAVPRSIAVTLGVVSAGALVSGIHNDIRLNTVSGDLLLDNHTGDVSVNAVSGEVQLRAITGSVSANTVSGDVTISGALHRVSVDGVSGTTWIDATGPINTIAVNTVSGKTTTRLDANLAANYVMHTLTGRVQVDGIDRGSSGPTNFTGSTGELAGTFVDLRVNSVSGSITVMRRDTTEVQDAAASTPLPTTTTEPTEPPAAPETPETPETPPAPPLPEEPQR